MLAFGMGDGWLQPWHIVAAWADGNEEELKLVEVLDCLISLLLVTIVSSSLMHSAPWLLDLFGRRSGSLHAFTAVQISLALRAHYASAPSVDA